MPWGRLLLAKDFCCRQLAVSPVPDIIFTASLPIYLDFINYLHIFITFEVLRIYWHTQIRVVRSLILCNYEANPRYCTFANSWSTTCREHSTCLYLCTVLLLRLVHET